MRTSRDVDLEGQLTDASMNYPTARPPKIKELTRMAGPSD